MEKIKVRKFFNFFLDKSIANDRHINFINEVIKEEDEYKNNNNNVKEAGNIKLLIRNKNEKINEKNEKNNLLYNNKIILNNKQDIKFQPIPLRTPNSTKALKKRSESTDKIKYHKYVDLNSITNDTSAYTNSLKKTLSYKINLQNRTEDASKFRTGLLSAGGSSTNNIIIPIIPMQRPNSNFIFGGEQLWNNFENGIINGKEKNEKNNNYKKEIEFYSEKNINSTKSNNDLNKMNNYNMYNIYNKSRNIKSQDSKKKYNTFMGIMGKEKVMGKLHKIKIEKGMMNSGIVSSLNKKVLAEYHIRIKQFKNSYLPMVFNGINKKNKIKIVSKFETFERNKFRSKSCNKDNVI